MELDGFLVLASGASNIRLGVELRVDLQRPYAEHDGRQHFLQQDQFVVLFNDPRLLIVKLQARYYQATIAVAHAPHSSHTEAERNDWWDQAEMVMLRVRPNMLMIDANAKVGSIPSPALMSSAPGGDEENDNGMRFRMFLEGQALVATNVAKGVGTDPTWFDTDDKGHRIDYVCVDAAVAHLVIEARPMHEVDISMHGRRDHVPVVCTMRYEVKDEASTVHDMQAKKPKLHIDRIKVNVPWRRASFENAMHAAYCQSHCDMVALLEEARSPLAIEERIEQWESRVRDAAVKWVPAE